MFDNTLKLLSFKLNYQAKESIKYRTKIYKKIPHEKINRILDIGSGTGVITNQIQEYFKTPTIGLDNNLELVHHANLEYSNDFLSFVCADANYLPFKSQSFDLVVCNLFLAFQKNPKKTIKEMQRVTKSFGYICCTMEAALNQFIRKPKTVIDCLYFRYLKDNNIMFSLGEDLKKIFYDLGIPIIFINKNNAPSSSKLLESSLILEKDWYKSLNEIYCLSTNFENDFKKEIELIKSGNKIHISPHYSVIAQRRNI